MNGKSQKNSRKDSTQLYISQNPDISINCIEMALIICLHLKLSKNSRILMKSIAGLLIILNLFQNLLYYVKDF